MPEKEPDGNILPVDKNPTSEAGNPAPPATALPKGEEKTGTAEDTLAAEVAAPEMTGPIEAVETSPSAGDTETSISEGKSLLSLEEVLAGERPKEAGTPPAGGSDSEAGAPPASATVEPHQSGQAVEIAEPPVPTSTAQEPVLSQEKETKKRGFWRRLLGL